MNGVDIGVNSGNAPDDIGLDMRLKDQVSYVAMVGMCHAALIARKIAERISWKGMLDLIDVAMENEMAPKARNEPPEQLRHPYMLRLACQENDERDNTIICCAIAKVAAT